MTNSQKWRMITAVFGTSFAFSLTTIVLFWSILRTREDIPSRKAIAEKAATSPRIPESPKIPEPPVGDMVPISAPNNARPFEEIGRSSRHGVFVRFVDAPGQQRIAQFRKLEDKSPIPSINFVPGRGVPLFRYSDVSLKRRGWATEPSRPDKTVVDRKQDTVAMRIERLTNFGTPELDRNKQGQFSLDHFHVWSPDGAYLFVITKGQGTNSFTTLKKIETRSWKIEYETRLHTTVTGLTWTSQGLIVLGHADLPFAAMPSGETWFWVSPSNRQIDEYRGGIFLFDPQTLKLRSGWLVPNSQSVAGHSKSDVIYLRNETYGVVAVNVKLGELVAATALSELARQCPTGPFRDQIHFLNPRLSDDGTFLISYGNATWTGKPSSSSNQLVGPHTMHRFRIAAEGVRWEQGKIFTGVRSTFVRDCDNAVTSDFVCVPGEQLEFVNPVEWESQIGKLTVHSETAVAIDTLGKSIYLCWPDYATKQLRLRVIRSGADIDEILIDPIEPKWFLHLIAPSNTRSQVERPNVLPFAMSASPDGRGVLVFTPENAFWIEPKLPKGSSWAFDDRYRSPELASQTDSASGGGVDADASKYADLVTRTKQATAIVLASRQTRSATSFCINDEGYFLTTVFPLMGGKVGDEVSLVIRAGSFFERIVPAKVVQLDSRTGIAMLKTIEPSGVPSLQLDGAVESHLEESTKLLTFGYPTLSERELAERRYSAVGTKPGFVTALRKSNDRLSLIQIDGVLSLGNSGGPVVDRSGTVLGVVGIGLQNTSLNFVVPANTVLEQDWEGLGRSPQTLTSENAEARTPRSLAGNGRPSQQGESREKERTPLKRAIDATALVVVPGQGTGTSFCVDKRGYFVTNSHVVNRLGVGEVVQLVLRAGTPQEQIVSAKIVKVVTESDLALLKVDADAAVDWEPLDLAQNSQLTPQTKVTAIGFPFGELLAIKGTLFPSASVNEATIEAVDIRTLGHASFQFQTQLNPGNSGGPVVDADGKVVGVVFATAIGFRKSYGIPLADLRRLMNEPELFVKLPKLHHSRRRELSTIQVEAKPFVGSLDEVELEIVLEPSVGLKTVHRMKRVGETTFELQTPFIALSDPDYVRVSVELDGGHISGLTQDHTIRVGGKELSLSNAPNNELYEGDPAFGLERVVIKSHGFEAEVDLSKSYSMVVETVPVERLNCTIVGRDRGQEFTTIRNVLQIDETPVSKKSRHCFMSNLHRAWSESRPLSDQPPIGISVTFRDGMIRGFTENHRFSHRFEGAEKNHRFSDIDSVLVRNEAYESKELKRQFFTGVVDSPGRSIQFRDSDFVGFRSLQASVGGNRIDVSVIDAEKIELANPFGSSTKNIQLHTPITRVAVGGGGKWLALLAAGARTILLFDCQSRKISQHIRIKSDDGVLLAATQDKLLVCYPQMKVLERWDLATGMLEQSAKLTIDISINSITAGANSLGPVLASGLDVSPPQNKLILIIIDVERLEATRLDDVVNLYGDGKSANLAASMDGNVFGVDRTAMFRDSTGWRLTIVPDDWTNELFAGKLSVRPSANGQSLFFGRVVFSPTGERLVSNDNRNSLLPTIHNEYLLSFKSEAMVAHPSSHIAICRLQNGVLERRVSLNRFDWKRQLEGYRGELLVSSRFHLSPDRKIFIAIPQTDDELIVAELPDWQ